MECNFKWYTNVLSNILKKKYAFVGHIMFVENHSCIKLFSEL